MSNRPSDLCAQEHGNNVNFPAIQIIANNNHLWPQPHIEMKEKNLSGTITEVKYNQCIEKDKNGHSTSEPVVTQIWHRDESQRQKTLIEMSTVHGTTATSPASLIKTRKLHSTGDSRPLPRPVEKTPKPTAPTHHPSLYIPHNPHPYTQKPGKPQETPPYTPS